MEIIFKRVGEGGPKHTDTYMPTFENQKSVQIMLFKKKRGTILTLLFNTTDKFVQEEEHLH